MTLKFSLQNVLDVRHSRVEAFEIELSKIIQDQAEAENRLANLNNLQNVLSDKLMDLLQGDMDLMAVGLVRSDSQQVAELINQAEANLIKIQQMLEAKRQELVAARQAEEVLQILKNKRQETFRSEQALREARSQDDIYIAQAFQHRGQ